MREGQRRSAPVRTGEEACRALGEPNTAGGARHHAQVPTECALCGAAEFSSVVEVAVGFSRVLHWISPPPGWYLLREARPSPGAPLLHGRCPECMARLLRDA